MSLNPSIRNSLIRPSTGLVMTFRETLENHGLQLRRAQSTALQINVGFKCNLACRHCHLEAGPERRELMNARTIEAVIACAGRLPWQTIDITGGAPELLPDLPRLIAGLAPLVPKLMVRTNLVALCAPRIYRFDRTLQAPPGVDSGLFAFDQPCPDRCAARRGSLGEKHRRTQAAKRAWLRQEWLGADPGSCGQSHRGLPPRQTGPGGTQVPARPGAQTGRNASPTCSPLPMCPSGVSAPGWGVPAIWAPTSKGSKTASIPAPSRA